MRKKLLIGLLVCGIVGDGGVCAHELWVTPYSLTAEFTGKKPYIYDTLNKKDIIVKEKNIFGHEDAVSDFTINADTLKNLAAHSRDFSHELAASLNSLFQ